MTKKNRKKILAIILSVSIVAGVVGAVIYFTNKNTNDEVVTTGSNSDWEEKYDFEENSDQYNTYEDHALPPIVLN